MRTDRRAALNWGESRGGAVFPIWLLTQGGGFKAPKTGVVVLHGSGASVGDALSSHVLPVLGRVAATSGRGASMIGSVVTVISSTKLPSARARGDALWMKFIPMIREYS